MDLGIQTSSRFMLQFVDLFGGFCFCNLVVKLLAGLAGQGVQVGTLRTGHRLVAGNPIVWVFLGIISGLLIYRLFSAPGFTCMIPTVFFWLILIFFHAKYFSQTRTNNRPEKLRY